MKKKKTEEEQTSEHTKVQQKPSQPEADKAILENISIRKEENRALKKLLNNLNTTLPKSKI